MRICYIGHSASHFVAPYVDHFAAQGHEVHVISFTHERLAHAVNHHPTLHDCGPGTGNLAYVRAIPAVRRLVRQIAPDLLHAHFLTSSGLAAAATGFHPLIVSARGSDIHYSLPRRLRRALVRFVMARADLVNPVSEELARLIAALGVPASKTLCLTQGIDAARFSGARRPAVGPMRAICTRKLQEPYDPEVIVEALARLAAAGHDFRFTFAAAGRDEAVVRSLVVARGLGERVVFLGGYVPDALPRLLADADVYVSAARWDGTSPALLEAMAAGLYPVVTDCPANREWLRSEDAGALFPAGDAAALAMRLAAAATGRDRWAIATDRNRETVAARADRVRNLTILGEHYERLVRGNRRAAGTQRTPALGAPDAEERSFGQRA